MSSAYQEVREEQLGQGLDTLKEAFFSFGGMSGPELGAVLEGHPDQREAKDIETALAVIREKAASFIAVGKERRGLASSNETVCRLRKAFEPYVKNLIDAPQTFKVLTACTGAAAAVPDILKAPAGASRFLLNGEFPYDKKESDRYTLGSGFQDGSVKKRAALSLVASAYYQAMESVFSEWDEAGKDAPQIIAASATAATATSRERRGKDHIWGAVRTLNGIYTYYATFAKGLGQDDRDWQDALCNILVTNSILAAAGLPQMPIDDKKVASEQLVPNPNGPGRILQLAPLTIDPSQFEGPGPFLIFRDGTFATREQLKEILQNDVTIYPGSFDIIHYGHEQVATTAYQFANKKPVFFEISASNVDPGKGDVDNETLARRVVQNFGRHPTLVTRGAPYFHQKLDLFPAAKSYVAGYDTAARIVNPACYPNGETDMIDTLNKLQQRGVTVYVLGRENKEGRFLTAADISCPIKYQGIFQSLTGQANISSSMLRALRRKD